MAKVLIADPDPESLETLKEVLASAGHVAVPCPVATDVHAALGPVPGSLLVLAGAHAPLDLDRKRRVLTGLGGLGCGLRRGLGRHLRHRPGNGLGLALRNGSGDPGRARGIRQVLHPRDPDADVGHVVDLGVPGRRGGRSGVALRSRAPARAVVGLEVPVIAAEELLDDHLAQGVRIPEEEARLFRVRGVVDAHLRPANPTVQGLLSRLAHGVQVVDEGLLTDACKELFEFGAIH